MFDKKKLKDISVLIGSGITPSRTNTSYWENGSISWVKTEQIGEHQIFDSNEKISDKALSETSIKLFPPYTISIAMYGEGKTRGNVSILKREMTTNQACCNIVLDSAKANYEYVYYYLKTQYHQLRSLSSGVRSNLNSNDIKEYTVCLPNELHIQQKIAAALSCLDAKIELNNKVNDNLEQTARTLYSYWFVQFDFPDKNGKPYKSSGGKMVYNEVLKREIPRGWKVAELRHYLTANRGVSYSGKDIVNGGISMINLNSFNINGTFKIGGTKSFSGDYTFSKVLKPLDLVMCNTQQTALDPQKDIIGKSFLVPDIFDTEIISSHHVTTIKVKDDDLKFYLNSLFNTDYFHRYISGYSTGTNILGLNFEGVLSYWTEIPTNELLSQYKNFILNVEKQKNRIIKENQQLTQLRDWLLPMLMNGQVKID